jgi:hypothetical protein
MNFLPRCVFAILLILAVMAQLARLQIDLEPDRASDLSGQLARLGGEILSTKPSGAATVAVSGCRNPVTLVQVGFNGGVDVSLDVMLATDAVPRYAYLGYVGDRLDYAAIASRWAAASALNVFGLRRAKAPAAVVLVLLPKECPRLAELDWSVLSPWS